MVCISKLFTCFRKKTKSPKSSAEDVDTVVGLKLSKDYDYVVPSTTKDDCAPSKYSYTDPKTSNVEDNDNDYSYTDPKHLIETKTKCESTSQLKFKKLNLNNENGRFANYTGVSGHNFFKEPSSVAKYPLPKTILPSLRKELHEESRVSLIYDDPMGGADDDPFYDDPSVHVGEDKVTSVSTTVEDAYEPVEMYQMYLKLVE